MFKKVNVACRHLFKRHVACHSVLFVTFRLHLLLAESIPTFTCNLELLSRHIGLRPLEINLDLLLTLLFTPAFIGTHNY